MTGREITIQEALQIARQTSIDAETRRLKCYEEEAKRNQMCSIPEHDIPITTLAKEIHERAIQKGFWESGVDRNDGEMIALMHSELSEALEAIRQRNPPSEHIPEFSGVEEEFADLIIRVLDTCYARGYRIEEAIHAKMKYNNGRPYKHGKEF